MLSIIIPCLNEGPSVRETVSNIRNTVNTDDYEIIVVDGGGTDLNSLDDPNHVRILRTPPDGVAGARNVGASSALGEILLFLDAHSKLLDGWDSKIISDVQNHQLDLLAPSIGHFDDLDKRGFGYQFRDPSLGIQWIYSFQSRIHEIPFASGCCMAIKKDTFFSLGQFDYGMKGWGAEDTEFCLRTWLFKSRVICDPTLVVGHRFRSSHPYKVDWIEFLANILRLVFSHFSAKRVGRYITANSSTPYFNEALCKAICEGLLERRSELFALRKLSDDWFFRRFPMDGFE